MKPQKACLVLENGTFFVGQSIGYEGEAQGEIVFNTSMTGYQEILTDPSYKGQIVTMTYPLIGNCGCNPEDEESHRPWVEGFVIKELASYPSNWRKEESLSDYLERNKIVAIQGIDTRKLTKTIRTGGAQRALISTTNLDIKTLLKKVKEIPSIVGLDLVKDVTIQRPFRWQDGLYVWSKSHVSKKRSKYFVIAYDFGIKRNILRNLASNNIDILVIPAQMSWKEVLEMKPHGVLLSNGPGDPEPITYAIHNIKNLVGRVPIFGICLGHQLLALALGGKTFKLKFGHRGANHPVKNLETGAIEITSQNHGFAVDIDSLKGRAKLTHLNLNDMTSEGFSLREEYLFSAQYHPEASPGPRDSRYLFQDFIRMMDDFKKK